jgi:hypothetical protein
MLLKALDLLRTLGWGVINFIFSLIDSLFDILKSLNSYNIIDSIAENTIFKNFHSGVIAIAITLLGLFAIWRFVMKVMDPDEGLSTGQIVKEIIKCGCLVILSTLLFAQASTFSIKLAGYTGNIFNSNNITIGDNMLSLYVNHSEGYKASDEFLNENISSNIKNDNFTNKKMYNDKYVTSSRWILPDEKDYKYEINWIMAVIVGGFFLYALFFSGMMLARRQIEFLFLFVISPIVFATSIGNKQRRSAVIEQLVSLMLQGAVVLLIICLTALVMQQVQSTTFFSDSVFKDMLVKSLMYIGCGSFLLTGSQVVNRFIGGNVSANSGREQMMAMMGFGRTMGGVATAGTLGAVGAGLVGAGAVTKGVSKAGAVSDSVLSKVGKGISNFGSKIQGGSDSSSSNNSISGMGNYLHSLGGYIEASAINRQNPVNKSGMKTSSATTKLNRFGSRMMNAGADSINSAVSQIMPSRAMYRRRYRNRGDS